MMKGTVNNYFASTNENNASLPSGLGYARVANVEPDLSESESQRWEIAFDVIGSDWLRQRGEYDDRFNLQQPSEMRLAWKNSWGGVADSNNWENPYEKAELYRVLVVMNPSQIGAPVQNAADLDAYIAQLESSWFELNINSAKSDSYNILAEVYLNAFAEPLEAYVSIQPVGHEIASILSILTDISLLPQINTDDVALHLSNAKADYLAVYDVGQGNANGLLGHINTGDKWPYSPTVYFDLGCGSSSNSHTKPNTLVFCTGRKPVVVLSHWDEDHWIGANLPSQSGKCEALSLNWIAPLQKVTTNHMAFIWSVFAGGGSVQIYSPTSAIGCAQLAGNSNCQIRFMLGTGSSRNNSGIVLAVERTQDDKCLSWILPGDCEYGYFLTVLNPAPPIAVVVPHHGAKPHTAIKPPAAPKDGYGRLVYSFGPKNKFRNNVQHPTTLCMQQHTQAGWDHNPWVVGSEGCILPNVNVRATSEHAGNTRGGILIGWTLPSVPTSCGRGCTTLPNAN